MIVIIGLLAFIGALLITAGLNNQPLSDVLKSWTGQ